MDAALNGVPPPPAAPRPVAGLRLAVPQRLVLDDLDDAVQRRFEWALAKLSAAGAHVAELPFAEIEGAKDIARLGGIVAPEAWAWHRDLVSGARDRYDPRVLSRIEGGAKVSAADYIDMLRLRAALQAATDSASRPFDALVLPAVAVVAPPIAPLEADDRAFFRANALILRNTAIGNLLNRPGISLPIGEPGGAPVGLMLMGERFEDARTLDVAEGVEAALASR
jgi:Asp-tRNA(Asn)/Glu-tRNA(Gln) amidotransferase A subunit family amidase